MDLSGLQTRDLQAFLGFSQHPARVYCAGKPIENVVYLLQETETFQVTHQTRVRVLDRGFQTPRNRPISTRPEASAFIVSRCLETPVKHDARVFDMASKTIHTSLVLWGYCFGALISHEGMYLYWKSHDLQYNS